MKRLDNTNDGDSKANIKNVLPLKRRARTDAVQPIPGSDPLFPAAAIPLLDQLLGPEATSVLHRLMIRAIDELSAMPGRRHRQQCLAKLDGLRCRLHINAGSEFPPSSVEFLEKVAHRLAAIGCGLCI